MLFGAPRNGTATHRLRLCWPQRVLVGLDGATCFLSLAVQLSALYSLGCIDVGVYVRAYKSNTYMRINIHIHTYMYMYMYMYIYMCRTCMCMHVLSLYTGLYTLDYATAISIFGIVEKI